MGKGIVGLSFDDGRADNKKVAEYLLSLKIPASFNITTGYVDGTCPRNMVPSEKNAITIEDVCWLHEQEIFEVALHGDKHLNSIQDISSGRDKIISWLGTHSTAKFGFASPGTGLDLSLLDSEKDFFLEKISYIRLALRIKSKYWMRTLARKASRLLHQPILYKIAYADTLMDQNEQRKLIYSVPVLEDITFQEVKALIDLCAKKKKILVLMFHSIETLHERIDTWSWSEEKFRKLCSYLLELQKKEKISILNVRGIYDYTK